MLLFYETQNVAGRHSYVGAPSVRALWPVNHSTLRGELIGVHEAASIIEPWRALCGDLAEENPFFEPWALAPALTHFADEKVRLACIWRGPGREELVGFAPVRLMRGYARLPVSYWATWMHPHCYYAAPLIKRGHEKAALGALFELLCDGLYGQAMLRLAHLSDAGPIAAAARAIADQHDRYHCMSGTFMRAALFAGEAGASYPEERLRAKKRKELRRLRNRLQERGKVSIRVLTEESECASWAEDFLTLEGKGWKGRQGTSLNSVPQHAEWFRAAVKGAFKEGKLKFIRLDLDARPVAMLVSFGADASFSLKTSYDPEFAHYSPGVMLGIENTKMLLCDPAFAWMDSCASSDHSMINSLWNGRRTITGFNISSRTPAKKALVRFCHSLEKMRALLPVASPVQGRRSAS